MVGEGGTAIGSGMIPRADVARLMVAVLFTPEVENRTFEIVSRAGLRGVPRAPRPALLFPSHGGSRPNVKAMQPQATPSCFTCRGAMRRA